MDELESAVLKGSTMRVTRFSVSRLMVLVGIIALNLAAARGLAASSEDLMVGVIPTVLVLQVALFCLIRTRGRRRAFWVGFLMAGLLAVLSLVGANQFSGSLALATDAVTGGTRIVVYDAYFGCKQMDAIWTAYVDTVVQWFPNLPVYPLVDAVVLLIPQMLAALIGGLLAWLTKRGAELYRSNAERRDAIPIKE